MERFTLKPRKTSRKDYSHLKTLGAENIIIPPPGTITHLPFLITNQGQTNDCSAFAAAEVRHTKTGKLYDALAFWQGELSLGSSPDGATMDTQGATGIKVGWTVQGDTQPSEKASAYFYVKPSIFGGIDWFDLIRSAIVSHGALSGGLAWYSEWTDAPQGIIPHTRHDFLGGHDVTLTNLNYINGIDYIDLSVHWGDQSGDHGLFHLHRFMANKVFENYGVLYWTDDPNIQIKKMGLIKALCVNVVNLIKRLIAQKNGYPPPIPQPAHISRIHDWALAIQAEEGWHEGSVSYDHMNPGNLKFTTLTEQWGAIQGKNAMDGGTFCKFPNYQTGFNALCTFLTLAAEDKLLAFHQARTLLEFTKVYANPPNNFYAMGVAQTLKVAYDINISLLL